MLFVLVYGSGCDWARNVLTAGHARLTIAGDDVELTRLRVIDEAEARLLLPESVKRPPRVLRIDEAQASTGPPARRHSGRPSSRRSARRPCGWRRRTASAAYTQ